MKRILALLLLPTLIQSAAPAAAPAKASDQAKMSDVELLQASLDSGKKLQEYEAQIHDRAESAVEIDDHDCQVRLQAIVPCMPTVLLDMIMKYGKPIKPIVQWPTIEKLLVCALPLELSGTIEDAIQNDSLLKDQFLNRWTGDTCGTMFDPYEPEKRVVIYNRPPNDANMLRRHLVHSLERHLGEKLIFPLSTMTLEQKPIVIAWLLHNGVAIFEARANFFIKPKLQELQQ